MTSNKTNEPIVHEIKDLTSLLFKHLKNMFKKPKEKRWLCGTPFYHNRPKEKDQYCWVEAEGNTFIQQNPPPNVQAAGDRIIAKDGKK